MPIDLSAFGTLQQKLRWPLTFTWAGLLAERLVRAFWPLWTLIAATAAALMLGLQDLISIEIVWSLMVLISLFFVIFAVKGLRGFRWPLRVEALARLDVTLPGHPLTALTDRQVIGDTDDASRLMWLAHQARMAERVADARPVEPDLKLARQDPFGLRYVALLGLVVALLFGSVWRAGSVTGMTPGGGALASGPVWEGWIEPPAYTGLPSLYLNDLRHEIRAPEGSRITIRFYGEVGALTLAETVSGRTEDVGAASDTTQSFDITRDGEVRIDGPGGQGWMVRVTPDLPPTVELVEEGTRTTFDGQMSQPFRARDDYGIVDGIATFELDLDRVDRRYGLAAEPDSQEPIVLQLPLPITGARDEFTETVVENLSEHPWAHLPVTLTLEVSDASEQIGQSIPEEMMLPARRFFDPVAAAVIEQRRDLLWAKSNAPDMARMLRAISHDPEENLFRDHGAYLKLRVILRRIEQLAADGALTDEKQTEIAQAMWDLAILLEEGDIGDALERMRKAQERLSEAVKRGASEEEIAELMQELRDATQDYLRQKTQQAQRDRDRDGTDERDLSGENREMTMLNQQDIQDMMDRIQELMEQGRMAEAQQALDEFQQMMENLRMAESQPGQGGDSPGQQAMEGLAETLRDQQGLSDQAFRDLQEQFNPGANQGQGQGQGTQGRGDDLGQGDDPDGQGQQGEQQGQGDEAGSLADRQEALRRQLEAQRESMPGPGTPEGDAMRDSLDRAEGAMEGAEQALRENDLAEAIDQQSEAMEALREGMRSLGDAMAQNSQPQNGQGDSLGQFGEQQSDPLGRMPGRGSQVGTQDDLLQGEDVYRRAGELLDEIRRRSGDTARPEEERDYLRRLLERF